MAPPSDSKLPQEILTVLPKDPNKQLEIAHKITYMAVSSRVGELERGVEILRKRLEEKDVSISALEGRINDLQQALQKSTAKLTSANEEKVKIEAEKNTLAATVKKLTRDVEKLEIFKKTLMHSLQEDNENEAQVTNTVSTIDPGKKSAIQDIGPTNNTQKSTHFMDSSPTDESPKSNSESTSPKASKTRSGTASPNGRLSKVSSKWHSIGSGRFSLPASKHSTAPNSPPHVGPQSVPTSKVDGKETKVDGKETKVDGKETKVDGKEFFRKVRNRLKYEQFSHFLANIKELNAHHQTREETLKKASEIFGPENEDLLSSFESLLSRHAPGHEG